MLMVLGFWVIWIGIDRGIVSLWCSLLPGGILSLGGVLHVLGLLGTFSTGRKVEVVPCERPLRLSSGSGGEELVEVVECPWAIPLSRGP